MSIWWTPGESRAIDQRDSARLLGVTSAQLVDGGWTRMWHRSGRGPDRPFDAYGEEGLHFHVAVVHSRVSGRHLLVVWEHELFVGHDHWFWRHDALPWDRCQPGESTTTATTGAGSDRSDPGAHDHLDPQAVLAAVDPFSSTIPANCPAWKWTVDDVVEYRSLANRDSAYRWLHEQGIKTTKSGWGQWYDGRTVVLKAAAMPGRGAGGGRPRIQPVQT